MNKTLFTTYELKELATPYSDLVQQNIQNKNLKAAKRLCNEMRDSQVLLHDFFAESCTVLWSWIGETLGEESIDEMFRYIFDQSARRQFFDAACAEVPPHLSVILLAKSWRSHSCFEAGEHPGKFSIHEDEKKFTFQLNPCGSGGRLIKAGGYRPMSYIQKIREKFENYLINASAHYLPLPEVMLEKMFPVFVNHFTQRKPKAQGRTEKPYSWSFVRSGIPYFCCQCAMVQSKYQNAGLSIIPPLGRKNTCVWKINKSFL